MQINDRKRLKKLSFCNQFLNNQVKKTIQIASFMNIFQLSLRHESERLKMPMNNCYITTDPEACFYMLPGLSSPLLFKLSVSMF